MLRLLFGVESHEKYYIQLDIVEQEQIGLLYISGFRSSSKLGEGGGGGVFGLNQTLRIRVAGLQDNFSLHYGPQSCLKNKEGALTSPEPLSGPRSANAIKPFT